ncbi:MAG: phage holin family protein [Chloroflexi bacterium]|nr:phage holin family protein [Chloroflexota bacterium]
MKKLILKLIINAVAFYAAVTLLRGQGIVAQDNGPLDYLLLGLIFGVVNAIVRPILSVLGCPFIILTLGLGILLINTLLFVLTGWIGTRFGVGFMVDGFWPAFFGALIVSVISWVLSLVLHDEMKKR